MRIGLAQSFGLKKKASFTELITIDIGPTIRLGCGNDIKM